MDPTWLATAAQQSPLGAALATFPWETTPLGPLSTWDRSLRQTVQMCFSTRFPVMIAWGPDLTMIYNDGYEQLLGTEKARDALGRSARDVWSEAWDALGPLFDDVLTTGVATWTTDFPLLINRSGFDEETYFTYSYSPLVGDDGRIAGLLDIATETTAQVVDRRRLALVDRLHMAMQDALGEVSALPQVVVDVLASSPDTRRCAVFLMTAGTLRLSAVSDRAVLDVLPDGVVDGVLASGEPALVGSVLVAPIVDPEVHAARGVLAVEGNAARPFDADQEEFLDVVVATVSAGLRAALTQQVQLDYLSARAELADIHAARARELSVTLQQSMLTPPPRPPRLDVAVRYQPAARDVAIGGDWYDAFLSHDDTTTLVIGDVTGHDHHAAAMMGQLRGLVRAIAFDSGASPARVLERTDRAITGLGLGPEATATVIVAQVEVSREAGTPGSRTTASHTVRWSSAGHPWPLVVRADGKVETPSHRNGVLLGIWRDRERHDNTIDLADGDTFLVYTDGLVERRDRPIDEGLDALTTALTGAHLLGVEELSDHLLSTLAPGSVADDVALVVVRPFAPAAEGRG